MKERTVLANGLVAARQAERVQGQFVAARASQLERDIILRQGADGELVAALCYSHPINPIASRGKEVEITHLAISIKLDDWSVAAILAVDT